MASPYDELQPLDRRQLIVRARRLGVERPEVMTRVELRDEIVRRSVHDGTKRRRERGWLGVARDLVAGLIEQGLHMPDAAHVLRAGGTDKDVLRSSAPVATVTLAEIYATQGHYRRALAMLDDVVEKEPDHAAALELRERLRKESNTSQTQTSSSAELVGAGSEPELAAVASASQPPSSAEPSNAGEASLSTPVELEEVGEARAHVEESKEALEPALLAVVREIGSVYLYWEMPERYLNRELTVVVVGLRPAWDGATRRRWEVSVKGKSGSSSLSIEPGVDVVRAMLASESDEEEILTVATVAREPKGEKKEPEIEWQPAASVAMGLPPDFWQRALESYPAGTT